MTSERVSPTLARCEKSCTFLTSEAGVVAALQAEGEHRARALGAIALRQRVIFVAFEAGIADPGHGRMLRQMPRDLERIVGMRCMRSGSVSMPVRIMKALNGEIAGPRSRRPSTRQAMAKAKLPKVSPRPCRYIPAAAPRASG
jgi:hypothetical protein